MKNQDKVIIINGIGRNKITIKITINIRLSLSNLKKGMFTHINIEQNRKPVYSAPNGHSPTPGEDRVIKIMPKSDLVLV